MHVSSSLLQFLRSSWGFVSTLVIRFFVEAGEDCLRAAQTTTHQQAASQQQV